MKNNNTIAKTAQESKDANMANNNTVTRREERENKYHELRINSLRRKCKTLKLSEEDTEKYVKQLEEELAKPKQYSILMLFPKDNKEPIIKSVTDNKIKYKVIGNEYGWLDGDERILAKLREIMPEHTRIFPYAKKLQYVGPTKIEQKKVSSNTMSRKQKSKAKKAADAHHCTIPSRRVKITVYKNGNGSWKNPGIPWKKQRKKEIQELVDLGVIKKVKKQATKNKTPYFMLRKPEITHKAFTRLPKHSAWYMEQLVQHKLLKWEKKNPKPILTDTKEEDMFKSHFLPEWEKKREEATVNIRNFVISIYDKNKNKRQPSKKALEVKIRTNKENTKYGEFWVRAESFFKDPNTGEPKYKIYDRKVNDKIPIKDDVGQVRTNYEHSIDKNVFVGMFKVDGKITKAFLPRNSSLYRKFIGEPEYKNAA